MIFCVRISITRGQTAGALTNLFEGSRFFDFLLRVRHLCFLDGRAPQSGLLNSTALAASGTHSVVSFMPRRIFQASSNHSSKSTIVTFCLWPPSFQWSRHCHLRLAATSQLSLWHLFRDHNPNTFQTFRIGKLCFHSLCSYWMKSKQAVHLAIEMRFLFRLRTPAFPKNRDVPPHLTVFRTTQPSRGTRFNKNPAVMRKQVKPHEKEVNFASAEVPVQPAPLEIISQKRSVVKLDRVSLSSEFPKPVPSGVVLGTSSFHSCASIIGSLQNWLLPPFTRQWAELTLRRHRPSQCSVFTQLSDPPCPLQL